MEVRKNKKVLRKYISEYKKSVSFEQMVYESQYIVETIEGLDVFKSSRRILAYWPMSKEVDLRLLMRRWHIKKEFLLPAVKGDALEVRIFEGENKLAVGEAYGILEPTGTILENLDTVDLVIVPGVAFDREGRRMGHGKAYYDKLLSELTNAYKIGVGFSFQEVARVPLESHDKYMDEVIFGKK